jgi:hypothetical protein
MLAGVRAGRRGDPVEDHRVAAAVVAAASPTVDDVMDALARLAHVRNDIDRVERELIGAARDRHVTWPDIATALGLGSRQAAEQRWLRLRGATSRDPGRVREDQRAQRTVDAEHGEELAQLRAAAIEAHRRIEADHGWDDRHDRAALARATLAAAISAPPGALYSLCTNALDDLAAMAVVRLPPALAAAVRRLREAATTVRTMSRPLNRP